MGEDNDKRDRVRRRRRELQARMPSHYCPTCTAVTYEEDERCLECDTPRPDDYGWPALRDSLDPWLGRVLDGRYLLTKRIGQGASASVYRAESLAILRQFAVKIIHPAKATNGPTPEQIAARLEREIEALGRLRNPHVVRFNDVIELPLNHIGVVMDFVQGDTLEALVERGGALDPKRAIELLRQMCNGVYEAHITGLTHRDLKPENVMVERLPAGDDFVHVLDFGIVHLDGETTMTQGFIGTPLYASPEQAMGEAVDHRSDIYSLGAIFFFMLTGRPPFVGNHVMQVLRQHVEREPPNLTETRGDGVDLEHLGKLVKRMLAKDVKSRPQNLQQVIDSLDQARFDRQDSGPILAPPSNAAETVLGHGAPPAKADSLARRDEEEDDELTIDIFSEVSESEDEDDQGQWRNPTRSGVVNPRAGAGANLLQPRASLSAHMALPKDVQTTRMAYDDTLRCAFIHEGTLHIYDLPANEQSTFDVSQGPRINCLALSETHVLLGRADGSLQRLVLETGEIEHLFNPPISDEVGDVAMSRDGKLMLAGMKNSGRVYMSAANKTERDWSRLGSGDPIAHIALSPRADLFAVAREDGTVGISRTSDPKKSFMTVQGAPIDVGLAFSDDGYLMGVAQERGSIGLFQVINGHKIFDIHVSQGHLLGFFWRGNDVTGLMSDSGHIFAEPLSQ